MRTLSKPKLLLDVAANLSNLADSLWAVAEAMAGNEPAKGVQPEKPGTAKEVKPAAKAVTLEQVRAALADKSQQGFTADVGLCLKSTAHRNSAKLTRRTMRRCCRTRRG